MRKNLTFRGDFTAGWRERLRARTRTFAGKKAIIEEVRSRFDLMKDKRRGRRRWYGARRRQLVPMVLRRAGLRVFVSGRIFQQTAP